MTFFLADSERAVGGLIFHCGIPPAVKVNYVVCVSQIQSRSAVKDKAPYAEYATKKIIQSRTYLLELGKDKHMLSLFVNRLADVFEHLKLSAVFWKGLRNRSSPFFLEGQR